MLMNSPGSLSTIEQVKQEIRSAQYRANVYVNVELLPLYPKREFVQTAMPT